MGTIDFLFLLALIHVIQPLHLHQQVSHFAITTADLKNKVSSALQGVTALNTSLASTISGLNPFNQEDRIAKMETAINEARSKLTTLYIQSGVPLNTSEYYCQQMTPQQISSIK